MFAQKPSRTVEPRSGSREGAPGKDARRAPAPVNPLWARLSMQLPSRSPAPQRRGQLAVSAPDDPAEREADAIADAALARSGTRSAALPLPSSPAAPTPSVQRKCAACDEENRVQRKAAPGAAPVQRKCAACSEEERAASGDRPPAQRKAEAGGGGEAAAPSPVARLLGSEAGQPLDAGPRAFMEQRLGRDFGSVRIHTGQRASESAGEMRALAYTVGKDIVFGRGTYAPDTREGQRLLAHELVHTVQQGEGAPLRVDRQVDGGVPQNDPRDAGAGGSGGDQVECVRRLGGVPETRPGGLPTCEEVRRYNQECRRETGYTGEDVDPGRACETPGPQPPPQPECTSPEGDPLDFSNRCLSAADRTAIQTATGVAPRTGPALPAGLRFVLHDTAAAVGSSSIARQASENRGALGGGVAAYAPAAGAATQTRTAFFEARRPTTSEYEKSSDVITQVNREAAVRQVWAATSDTERDAAVGRATAGHGYTPQEETAQATSARAQLNATSGMVYTTAHWVAEEICGAVTSRGVAAIARSPAQEADLTAACGTLAPYFTARSARVSSQTNVEIVQPAGSNCATTGTLVPLPAYSADQYSSVQRLYLLAAHEAGRFPEITTHFWVDRTFRGHCDPRCFNLGNLYGLVQAALGHPAGARYGAVPNYGPRWGTHNVWWNDTVCSGSHP
jgi:hypothetical protein